MAKRTDGPDSSATGEVIDFTAYKNRDLIDVLTEALADARAGRINGAILVLEREGRNHGVTVVGSYESDPRRVSNIAGEIFVRYLPRIPDRPTIKTD